MRIETPSRPKPAGAERAAGQPAFGPVDRESARADQPATATVTGSERAALYVYFRPFVTEGWRTSPRAAFTLLHLLGVLLVMAIILLALMPTQIRQIDLDARKNEAQALGVLSTGLRNYILDARRVPATNTVFSDIAGKIGWALPTVLTNARGNPRLFVVDPAFQLGNTTATSLPYVQGTYGVTNVAGLRLLLVSSISSDLPAAITAPGTNAARVFEMLWNSSDNVMPAGWTFGGNWEDIVVQRLSLVPMFAQVVLMNSSADTGRFSMDALGNATNHVPLPASYFSSLYFVRSLLGLHNSTGAVQAVQILQDVSLTTNGPPYFLCPTFVYEDGQWRGRYWKGTDAQRHKGEDLQAAYDLFMSGPANVYSGTNVNQQTVTMSMYMFMSNYVRWASREFRWADKAAVSASQSVMAGQLGTYCDQKATTQ